MSDDNTLENKPYFRLYHILLFVFLLTFLLSFVILTQTEVNCLPKGDVSQATRDSRVKGVNVLPGWKRFESTRLARKLTRNKHMGSRIQNLNKMSDIKKHLSSYRTNFETAQTINSPYSGSTMNFAKMVWVHDSGIIASYDEPITVGTNPNISFYRINSNGSIVRTQQVSIDFNVYYGSFAPEMSVSDEVFYLYLSTRDDLTNNELPPRKIYVMAYDSSKKGRTNGVWTAPTLLIEHPFFTDAEYAVNVGAGNSYYGTFGEYFVSVVDTFSLAPRQSIYIRGSEYDTSFPGGNIFWYILNDNEVVPSVDTAPQQTIQDAKLRQLSLDSTQITFVNTPGQLLNSFGIRFLVVDGLLIVANPSGEDNGQISSAQPAAPNGYVQIFKSRSSSSSGVSWYQPTNSTGTFFTHRYIPPTDDPAGFGYSLGYRNTFLLIGNLNSDIIRSYNVSEIPRLRGSISTGTLFTATSIDSLVFAGKQTIEFTDNYNFVFINRNLSTGSSIVYVNAWDGTAVEPFTVFEITQTMGNTQNSNSGILGSTQPYHGFGQTGTSNYKTDVEILLITADPYYSSNEGRIVVYSQDIS